MLKEHDSNGFNQAIEFIRDRKRDIYGSTLEPLYLDNTTRIVCRDNITNTFTKTENGVHAHTYLFFGSHGERINGDEPRTFIALRGKTQVQVDKRLITLRRGERVTIQPGQKWNITNSGITPFEYSVDLPLGFDVRNVLGELINISQLPNIERAPFTGPFNYAKN